MLGTLSHQKGGGKEGCKAGTLHGDTCRITKVENVNEVCVEEEIQRSGMCRRKKRDRTMEWAGKILIL